MFSQTAHAPCKRVQVDRRKEKNPLISRYVLLGGKRKSFRRRDDRGRYLFVDLYSPGLMIVLLAILILNFIDSYLTLTLLQRGLVYEANPLMSLSLERGIHSFIIHKGLVTAISITILCIFKNLNFAKTGLLISLILYIVIVLYQFCILNIA